MATQAEWNAKKPSYPGQPMGPGYGYSNAPKPPAPAPAAGVYPGAPPSYSFAPVVDRGAAQRAWQMQSLARQQAVEEKRARAAELYQAQSQWYAPRQSRMTFLKGY